MIPSILVLSDDPEFARAVLARWQSERTVPAFTVMGAEAWKPSAERQPAGIAVVGGDLAQCSPALKALEHSHVPAIYVAQGKEVSTARQRFQRTAVLKRSDDWLDALVLLATEMLRRVALGEHAAEAEKRAKEAERNAVLGKYMLEMRHGLNNALTSVLGNAELLLLEPGTLAGEAREQVDTIHSMSLRMHEIIQRFSSIETEMKFADSENEAERAAFSQGVASGK
jgi:two-component system, NtrC family, sensor kinase